MNEMIIFCLDQVNCVRMIVQRHSSKEVYDSHLSVILYDGVCSYFRM